MLADMKIRYKLALLMLLPLAGFLFYSGLECLNRYNGWNDSDRLVQAVDVLVDMGGLAHQLQKERGLSAGYAASKGQNFAQDLAPQRSATDDARQKLEARLKTSGAVMSAASFAKSVAALRSSLEGLRDQRSRVDSLATPPAEIIASYSAIIDSILEGCSNILTLAGGTGMTRPAAAYVALLRGKEMAGQERAILNGAFAAGKFSPELYRDWLRRVGEQNAYLLSFRALGGEQAANMLTAKTGGPDKEVETFRELAFKNQNKDSLGGDPRAWFTSATTRIDALKQVEDGWAENIRSRATKVLESAKWTFFGIWVGASVLGSLTALLGWFIFMSINKPIRRAADFADAVAGGDLGQTLDVRQGDEIGKLCSSLTTMLGRLREQIQKSEQAMAEADLAATQAREAAALAEEAKRQADNARVDGMHAAAERLEEVVQGVTHASETLSSEVEQASHGARLQSERVSETSLAMEEMNLTVLEVAKNAASAAETTDKARQEAVSGSQVVREAVSGINHARDDSLELKRHMGALGAKATDIGRIMGVISDIADQTNLLALNAAIEAARAGEAGRGFAVVADEVRKLAEKTMTATREVAESIQGIQEGAATTIHNVELAVVRIEEATQLAAKSGEALESIVKYVDEAAHQVNAIATVSGDQSTASGEINHYLEEVNRISGETVQAMEHSSQAVSGLARQARNLEDMVEELRGA